MFTRLFRPHVLFDIDETVAATPDVEAPTVDQPDVDTPDVTPETAAPGTTGVEEQAPTDTSDTGEADETEESFTDIDVSTLTEAEQARYKQMQAAFTQKTQALAERHAELDNAVSFVTDLVADAPNETQEAVFRNLAERLGYDIEGDDDTDDTPDEPESTDEVTEFRDPRLDPIIAEREAEAEATRQAEYEAHLDEVEAGITEGITELAKADGIELTEAEADVVFDIVLAIAPDGNGPAVKAAYERYKAATKADRDRWVKSKQSTPAPNGPPAEDAVDFSNEEERLAYTARAVEAAQRAQSGL